MTSDETITTANVADACMRLGLTIRCAPPAIRPLFLGAPLSGRALPVKHHGSVDVFLEAFENRDGATVLVIDNEGRDDEACIGDLVAIEAKNAGIAGAIIWGAHRDSAEIREIGLKVFSTGTRPMGPSRLDARTSRSLVEAQIGNVLVTRDDHVFADDDGVLFVSLDRLRDVREVAAEIQAKEALQAQSVRQGRSLRDQFEFARYLKARESDSRITFREHLRGIAAEIEE